ncbi:uncharacterized protein PAC_15459 [Phialocephala subalpina]|uniref:SRPBCC family protein n=1 Tax=Phialocephala subalpina TaxID=576137 RepID=A0A1L7XKJ0_9HELO|nr:uncharacterized protein PAC_15459 [Phialocephala subalpina]
MSQTRTLICKEVVTINQPIGAVWAIISGFGAIKTWMPAIDSCLFEGDGIGAVRIVKFKGRVISEQLEICDPESHTISYRFLDPTGFPMLRGFGTISLIALDTSVTQVTWIADAEVVDDDGIAKIAPVFAPFIRENITTLQSHLERPSRH